MRKGQFNSLVRDPPAWMDLERIAEVAVTSEDPAHPIECAFRAKSPGWRAGGRGEQRIRLIFDSPQRLTRVWLRFVETEIERTQEFSLRWWPEKDGLAREIVRIPLDPQGRCAFSLQIVDSGRSRSVRDRRNRSRLVQTVVSRGLCIRRTQHTRIHELFTHAESLPFVGRGSEARTGAFRYAITSLGVLNRLST